MKYSIKDLERITGIQAHTIRTWEKRHDLLKPKRSDTNIRYYDDEDLKKLLNITTLLQDGMKISTIAALKDSELNQRIRDMYEKVLGSDVNHTIIINQMISAASNFDVAAFESAFSSALIRFPFDQVYEKVFYPLLIKIGMMWSSSDILPVQEHFITNLIKQKMFTAIDALPTPDAKQEKWLLFLSEDEQHEIGLLMAYFLLRKNQKQVIYLGQNVPMINLEHTIVDTEPDNLLLFKVKNSPIEDQIEYIDKLVKISNNKKIWICGEKVDNSMVSEKANIVFIDSYQKFEQEI